MTKKQKTIKEAVKEIIIEFGSTSPVRNWRLEDKSDIKEFKRIQKENFKHIDDFTAQITNLFKERLEKVEKIIDESLGQNKQLDDAYPVIKKVLDDLIEEL